MIFKTLDTIPYKLFLNIVATDDYCLLSDNKDEDKNTLHEIWKQLYAQHEQRHKTPESLKNFDITKTVTYLEGQRKVIIMACESLSFDYDQDLIDLLNEYGYTFEADGTEQYYNELKRIFKESSGILFKINQLKKQLPKQTEDNEYSIDDVMASYAAILGIDFDYNAITYTKFHAIQKQVHLKMKQIEAQRQQQLQQSKKNKKNGR
jgi:hypothetical protein